MVFKPYDNIYVGIPATVQAPHPPQPPQPPSAMLPPSPMVFFSSPDESCKKKRQIFVSVLFFILVSSSNLSTFEKPNYHGLEQNISNLPFAEVPVINNFEENVLFLHKVKVVFFCNCVVFAL